MQEWSDMAAVFLIRPARFKLFITTFFGCTVNENSDHDKSF